MKYSTPTQRLHNLLQWTLNADTEEQYWYRLKYFQKYLDKIYKKTIKNNYKKLTICQDGNN